jgi:hypothetical protein
MFLVDPFCGSYAKRNANGMQRCGPIESIDDEDEVLLALAGELGDFVEYIGGAQ